MKKTIACICIIFGVLGVRATVLTNYVYVVSNIFNNVFTESVITQKVKSSHTNYYYTNYVSVVTNVYQTTYRTNVSMNVDVSQKYVYAAANAASNALWYANQLAAAATDADSSASYADSAMNRAEMYAAMASSAASDGLQRINDRINWFDQHSGETITNVNVNVTTNIYVDVDDIDMSYKYVDLQGNAYDNVIISPYGTNSCVSVYPRKSSSGQNYYASTVYKITLYHRKDNNTVWEFVPAYVDYDSDGLRLQFVPRNPSYIPYITNDQSDGYYGKRQVPAYMYWQNGTFYFKVNMYDDDNNVMSWGIFTHSQTYFPEPIPLSVLESQSVGKPMDIKSRFNYGSRDNSLAYIRTFESFYIRDIPLVFPMHASDFHKPVVNWMRMGPMLSTSLDAYNYISSISNWVETVFQKKSIGD